MNFDRTSKFIPSTAVLSVSALALVAVFVGSSFLVGRVEDTGRRFFETGSAVVASLDRFAGELSSRDFSKAGAFYSDRFAGTPLGLSRLEPADGPAQEKNGVRRLRFQASETAFDRAGALDEWRSYLESFESVEKLVLHLHRLPSWESPGRIVASVRFELIGRPKGALREGVDRAYFEFEFESVDCEMRILRSSLIDGERIINDQPQFLDVSSAAGIDFENQYYPQFLSEPLAFGMIRYGPGGISTVDYDNDGFYDLFIPDGVESKLFRNLGNGTFEDMTATAGLTGLDGVSVGVFGDFDNDGWKDLFVSRTFTPN